MTTKTATKRASATETDSTDNSVEARQYAKGCNAGRIAAERFLQELRTHPDLTGLPYMIKHFNEFGVKDHPTTVGKWVGFCTRIELEMAQRVHAPDWKLARRPLTWLAQHAGAALGQPSDA